MASVSLKDVHVEIPIYNASARSLKKQLVRATTGGRIASDHGRTLVKALNGVNLELRDGDRLGLVGHNGAGKTTLLRVLAGVYEPTRGSVAVHGHVMPLLDVGMGIDPESTGYENIRLRGTLIGIGRTRLNSITDEIAQFTELGDYLEMPVRTYSAGMILRLAFGISTCVTPDVLLMDEYFAVGDATFVEKAERRLNDLVSKAGIIVFASHSQELIQRLCNKAIWMRAGEPVEFGEAGAVLERYARETRQP